VTTVMWEARSAPGRADELVAFACAHAHPSAQVYRSRGDEARVVVIDPSGAGLPDVPPHLLARPPHAWPFEPVTRPGESDPSGALTWDDPAG
jgi:hypothetical protein